MKRVIKAAESDYIKIGDRVIPTNTADMRDANYDEVSRRGRRRYDEEKRAEAEEAKRQEAIKRGNQKLVEVNELIKSGKDPIDAYFEVLVPSSGTADTVAGEIARAMMRILYRDWNDGDKFFSGYGWETCMPSAAYLMDTIGGPIKDKIIEIAQSQPDETAYTDAIKDLSNEVENYLFEHPELLGTENTEDSRDWDISYKYEELQAKYDFDFSYPWQVEELLSQGKVDLNDVRWELESWESFRNAEVEVWDDYAEAIGLDEDTYNELVRTIDRSLEYWGEEWATEYGLDDEEEEDYEEEDYEDEDEEY